MTTSDQLQAINRRIKQHGDMRDAARQLAEYHAKQFSVAADELAALCAACVHDWRYKYTGRHGSDKGDDYYECRLCGADKREA